MADREEVEARPTILGATLGAIALFEHHFGIQSAGVHHVMRRDHMKEWKQPLTMTKCCICIGRKRVSAFRICR